MAAETSPLHPSEVAACKAEFMLAGVAVLTEPEINALIQALETEIVFTTVTLAGEKYNVGKAKLKRELEKQGFTPIPGSTVYRMCDIIICVNTIRERKNRGFFG